ncbi:type II secretion system F family protein [Anaerobacillus alkaliphilus]|uniref:Type II secretion system F family protein n=1 Tax=Anaerobacillus alkaliphilus TaxID=1548597 RepID=A0A4Q0VV67_9BACI|nr:type II secretion system F family protein [Anaerobacillus alkaliphilus]RXJ01909.1 type II secretion system F family protein [Anaerobacillus alkaliphilus]
MMYLTFFLTITLLVVAVLISKQQKPPKKKNHRIELLLSSIPQEDNPEENQQESKDSLFRRVFQPIVHDYKRSFKQRVPGEKVAKIEQKLLQAGSPFNMTPVEFRLLQLGLFILLPTLFGLYGLLLKNEASAVILFGLIGLVVSLVLPNYYLKQKAKARGKQALKELPDTLDLLTVSLEAGLGFDAALSKIVAKKDGVLSDELTRCLEEMRLGRTRREALTGVKERIVVQEISVLINSILQAEKLGIGMVQVLRVQSQDVRDRRKQRAEEEAMKAPIKMLFPLVLFIFPSLFIVLLGPAMIQLIETFSK